MIYKVSDKFGHCKISVDDDIWTISVWWVDEKYRNRGYGKKMLTSLIKQILRENACPNQIRYIWNGQNEYVHDWLNKFNAKCVANINIVKNAPDDDWESRIYILDTEMFLKYCDV